MSSNLNNWKHNLFSCCDSVCMSFFTCLVPCSCAFIQCIDAKLVYPESKEYCAAYFCAWLGCFGLAYNRAQIRNKLSIEGSYCIDCVCHTCCCCCSLVQE